MRWKQIMSRALKVIGVGFLLAAVSACGGKTEKTKPPPTKAARNPVETSAEQKERDDDAKETMQDRSNELGN